MRNRRKQFGVTLTELVVVVAVVALLVGLAIPAVKTFNSMVSSSAGIESMISAALSSGRALAAKHQKYAGIRFQQDKDGNQYMIPIIHDSTIGPYVQGNLSMKAAEELKPIKISAPLYILGEAPLVASEASATELADRSVFTVLFSPEGNIVIHSLWVRNRDGNPDGVSEDSIFNTVDNVDNRGIGKFYQDESAGIEDSVKSLMVYDKKLFDEAVDKWEDYLKDLDVIYINPYTGGIISQK